MTPPRVIGLIGGIGSGKSAVAEEFARLGATVISGDAAGHEALRDPILKKRVVERWGPGILDDKGEVVRRRLSQIVFSDPAERQALETIVFPWIGQRLRDQIAQARSEAGECPVILDAAVMLEAGWNGVCDRLIFVDVPRPDRLRRLIETRGWTEKEVYNREAAQMPLTEKKTLADVVVDNSGSRAALAGQVEELWKQWGFADCIRQTEPRQ